VVELEENFMQAPVKLRRTSGFSARHKKKAKSKDKNKSFPGITEETAKAIEDALSEAMTDDEKNPTSLLNTLKGRNNTLRRKKRNQTEEFSMGGDVRYNPSRGKTY
tara:strand:- start:43 stop:360 length:318 start_codon:yes stop_codon:yes gene_type:complete